MADAGCRLLHDMTPLALMFFLRVLARLPVFFRLLRDASRYFRDHRVDAVVLIDYPGFNWCVARRAKRLGIPVFYFGAPQIWAWAPWRVRKLRRRVDYTLCQLPFEPAWYGERNCQTCYVGHPFFDEAASDQLDLETLDSLDAPTPLLVLLPGSRRAEVVVNADCFLQAAQCVKNRHPLIRIAAACYADEHAAIVRSHADRLGVQVDVRVGRTRELIRMAYACIACSGSVSLQLLAERRPTVIYFQITRLQWLIKQCLMRVKYITLVNLLSTDDFRRRDWRTYDPDAKGAEPVPMPEYLTTQPCPEKLAAHVLRWIEDRRARADTFDALDTVARRVAHPGATRRAADFILRTLDATSSLPKAA
jgi:lipid-A-disaccharide synthase